MGIVVRHNMVISSIEESNDRIRLDAAANYSGKFPEYGD